MNFGKLRAWWMTRQGLDGSLKRSKPSKILECSGWARSVGGSNPYITLYSRGETSREEVDSATRQTEIQELPSARGCTYVIPKQDYSLALSLAWPYEEKNIMTAQKYLGITNKAIDKLCDGVLKTLKERPLEPQEIKQNIDHLIKNFGAEGKKRGLTTSLPLALGRLQTTGEIRRISVNERFDTQRYKYTIWNNSPQKKLSTEEAATELAKKFFTWIGPAKIEQFQWFSGFGVKTTKDTVASLNLVDVGEGWLMLPEHAKEFNAFSNNENLLALVSSLDAMLLLRRDLNSLLEPADHAEQRITEKYLQTIGGVQDLESNPILQSGRIIGLWEFDPDEGKIVWVTFGKKPKNLDTVVKKMETFIREQLGDARSFSLDSPTSRRPKIEFLKSLS
jgi:hypothetical protein